jgi:hypothetical protein
VVVLQRKIVHWILNTEETPALDLSLFLKTAYLMSGVYEPICSIC